MSQPEAFDLEVKGLCGGYGSARVLFNVDLTVRQGQAVSLLGRNGMGKTTLLNSIMGIASVTAGSVTFGGRVLTQCRPFVAARAGLGLVPEQRQIFENLTVRENLTGTAANRLGLEPAWTLERVFAFFPILSKRARAPAWTLSGGEKQMLAIGRALLTNPRLLLLDEATEGLAPLVRDQIWEALRQLRELKLSMLVVDRDMSTLLDIASHHYVIEKGVVVWSGSSDQLRGRTDVLERYLSIDVTAGQNIAVSS